MAANAARGHLVDLSISRGWDEIEGVEGSLRDFLLEQAGVSYKLSVARLELRATPPILVSTWVCQMV